LLRIAGAERADVAAIMGFYSSLGCIEEATISRVFAPDEALFRPYFSMVSGVLPHIIRDGGVSKIFAQALDYYENQDFQHCISTLGLISEDYLQRIYTTLLREQISGGMTLGQTLDRLHRRIDELFPSVKVSHKSLDALYGGIGKLEPESGMDDVKSVLREIVYLIGDDRSCYGKKLDEIMGVANKRTPFPSRIMDNLNELLKWRNAASHNSRVPLGAHEADRTLYCLVSMAAWWEEQLGALDWSKSKLEIIEYLVRVAKPAK